MGGNVSIWWKADDHYAVVLSRMVAMSGIYSLRRIVTTPATASSEILESVMLHWAMSAATGAAILTSGPASPLTSSLARDDRWWSSRWWW